jgi:hypothetical protein
MGSVTVCAWNGSNLVGNYTSLARAEKMLFDAIDPTMPGQQHGPNERRHSPFDLSLGDSAVVLRRYASYEHGARAAPFGH